MIVTIVLILAAVGFTFLLVTPLAIEVDTDRSLYRIRLKALITASIVTSGDRLLIQIWILGWEKTIDPIRLSIKKARKKKESAKKSKRRMKASTILRKARAVLRSFRLSFFYLNIDTDDFVMNSWLYPIAELLTKGDKIYRINYNGELSLRFQITNRIGKILFALTQ